jgi:hypothetical protein
MVLTKCKTLNILATKVQSQQISINSQLPTLEAKWTLTNLKTACSKGHSLYSFNSNQICHRDFNIKQIKV